MTFVFCALRDPFFDEGDFPRVHYLVTFRWRHDLVLVLRFYQFDQLGFSRVSFDDDWRSRIAYFESFRFDIKAQGFFFRLARAGIRSMAVVAILGKDGLDVLVERNDLRQSE